MKRFIKEIDEMNNSKRRFKIKAKPHPYSVVIHDKTVKDADAAYVVTGAEDGWLISNHEDYLQAKQVVDNIKLEAYKEFAELVKLHRRKMSSADFGGEFWDYAILEEDIDATLKELEEKLNENN